MGHKYEVIQVAGKTERGLPSWTILIDGNPTLQWSPTEVAAWRKADRIRMGRTEAFGKMPTLVVDGKGYKPEPLTDEQAAEMRKTLLGRGLPAHKVDAMLKVAQEKPRARVMQKEGPAEFTTVTMGSGRTKQRMKPKPWRYELDGVVSTEEFASEAEAREDCAVKAYLSGGKLGRLPEAAKLVEAQYGVTGCVGFVCKNRHKALVRDSTGEEYIVGVSKDGVLSVKALTPDDVPYVEEKPAAPTRSKKER